MLTVAFFSSCASVRWDVCLSLLGVVVLKQINNRKSATATSL